MPLTGQLGTAASQPGQLEPGFQGGSLQSAAATLAGSSSVTASASVFHPAATSISGSSHASVFIPIVEGGVLGTGSGGTAPVAAWSLDPTGPSIFSIYPANGATSIPNNATVIIVWTAPDGIDPWSLSVTLAGLPAVAGGQFYSGSYGGSIVVDQQTATITISTHPAFSGATTTISTTAFDLENKSATSNTSFLGPNVGVSDTVTVTDALATHDVYGVPLPEMVTITEAATPSLHVTEALSDTATASDALVSLYNARPPLNETLTISEAISEHQVLGLPLPETVPIADQAIAAHNFSTSISEHVSIAENLAQPHVAAHAMLAETVPLTESVHEGGHEPITINETVAFSESLVTHYQAGLAINITVPIFETFQAGAVSITSNGVQLTIGFPLGIRITGALDPNHYNFPPEPGDGGFPFSILSIAPVVNNVASGSQARVISSGSLTGGTVVQFADGTFTINNVGDYISLNSNANHVSYLRVLQVLSANEVVLDKPLIVNDPQNGFIPWSHTSPVMGVIITTTKQTNDAKYNVKIAGLTTTQGQPFTINDSFTATAAQPQVTNVDFLPEGQVVITFSDPMLDDGFLTDPDEYSITGPTKVRIEYVQTPAPNQVMLTTSGMGAGSYLLTVNAHGTPHDLAGNPIDPLFNQAVFTGAIPLAARSIFTDMGPITKAPNIFQTGTKARVVDPVTLNLLDGSLDPTMIGLLLTISGGSGKNGGTFLITSVPTSTQVKLNASFTIPDSPFMHWKVFDPRDGEIADDPSDVQVTINGTPTPALDVVGLLGQIILATAPNDGDKVLVNYNWVQNPVIDLRRLNSREFRFNSWNRDLGYIPDPSRHKYRYNNTLAVPSEYVIPVPIMSGTGAAVTTTTNFTLPGATLSPSQVGLTVRIGGVNGGDYIIATVIDPQHITITKPVQIFPDPGSGTLSWEVFDPDNLDERAPLPQPLQRDLKYRAYERAYTALLNDPSTLLFNSPTNKIAFPPLQRPLSSVFVNYQATGLPQNDPVAPWTLHGTGTANIVNNELVVTSSSAGPPFPSGQPIFWTRTIDLTFPHVFASSWRLTINADPTTEGVFTGVASGFSDGEKCCVVGFLDNAGTRMIGILKAGAGNDPSQLSAWIGGVDGSGNATLAPVAFDWSTIHSYRLFQDQTGNISIFVDGGVIATLLVAEADLPFLSELNEPFNQLQGIYFGALSRLAISTSTWDFLRYEILPINPEQVAPSVFVSYEADRPPETASQPWTPIGAHGTETIPHAGLLILDSTSATDNATEVLAGLIDGDFRGFDRIEPLLSAASSVALDVNVQLLTWTHGISPNAVMVAVDDSNFLIQLCFFPGQATSLFSYGGRSFPDQFQPYVWTRMGGQTARMIGQLLQINDASTSDGLLYAIDDNPTPSAPNRVVSFSNDYILEFRVQVVSFTADPGGFCGVNAEVYDSLRDLGVLFRHSGGNYHVALHSEGTVVSQFLFNWNDGQFHTYRMVKNTAGNLVTLFIDTVLVGTAPYSSFAVPAPSTIGVTSFGSTTPGSAMSMSVVNWVYCNVWRVSPVTHHYAGIWKGVDPHSLTGYHLPLKTRGRQARVAGNGVEDLNADFVADGVVPGDVFIVDVGPNKGVYEITSVTPTILTVAIQTNPPIIDASANIEGGSAFSATATDTLSAAASLAGHASVAATAVRDTTLIASSSLSADAIMHGHAHTLLAGAAAVSATATINSVPVSPSPFPVQPSTVDYRIPLDVDWTLPHRYRIVRDPGGGVALFIDSTVAPAIDLGYNNLDLPPSSVGLPDGIAAGLPSIVWGAFDPTNLSQTAWQYVRYGITRPAVESQIVPPHQILNQRNVMQSYERHLSNLPHTLTDFWSESEGITPQTDPDFLENPGLVAYTLLNDGTPLVPSTQTYEVRRPTPVLVPVVGFNNPQDLLNSQAFVMNESEQRIELIVPPDVLYNSLQVIEHDTGTPNLLAPFNDESQPYSLGAINFQKTVCLTYDGTTFPENDPNAASPWIYQADHPTHVIRTITGGIFTYGTTSQGAQTVYSNVTPLPDAPSLTTQVTFRLKLVNDASGGLGDSQVRFGLSAPGLTISLAFITEGNGQRYVVLVDQNNGRVVGGIPFDFLDGNFHTYRIVRNPTFTPPVPPPGPPVMPGLLQVFIDS